MIKLVSITLENEMDLVLAHKRSMIVAEKLGLTLSTQTTFATAVSEIARTIIEHTDQGILEIGLEQQKARYSLFAHVAFDKEIHFTNDDSGFYYAQKLVPEFNMALVGEHNLIQMKIGLPRSLKLDPTRIAALKVYFLNEQPLNAYEEIKQRNISLNKLAGEKEEELRQSKLIDEKKTEFISVASHEIKTPMTVLKAYTQMAKATKEPISERLRLVLEKIDLQSTKLMQLVQQLMDISKIENGNLQYNLKKVQLNKFLVAQLAVMQQILPDYELFSELGSDAEVNVDELRMEQVFSNLLGNAAKYSDKGTHITVSSNLTEDGMICISIKDQGKGISKNNLKSIFDKFFRAEDVLTTHAGLGMGLFITSKIITDHGGKIWVESEIGQGSTFFFTLPSTHS
ncbi:ATP-binding protein [Pedobacter boryungensis]|uniref:histidine kinase n=1 Tax=Pedobacter boryungensis TaxID=869962 RepID=A0ABX2DDP3_9SPHI|nr:sensor histidine kinase [Pedobacter boryungensis]NQX31091.1 sensor histidine kinase [Pedobacter boryungensis]